jgi:nicotinate dehydrogenase subunit B
LRYLKDPRGAELLERLARLAAWEKPPSPQRGTGDIVAGRGISYVKYELQRTYIGAVAEVEVKRNTGAIKVTRFSVVHDCGHVINPDGVKNQIKGNVVQTVSRTLWEELKFDRSRVTSVDWGSYPILTFPEVPEVVIELIDRPSESPGAPASPRRRWCRRPSPTPSSTPSAPGSARSRSRRARCARRSRGHERNLSPLA